MAIIKVQVQYNTQKSDYDLNRDEPLHNHISNLSHKFNVQGDLSTFTLQVDSTKHYIEEYDLSNSSFSIPSGSLLVLKMKPAFAATASLQALQDPNVTVKKKAIFELKAHLKDEKFAQEFLNANGINQITLVIEDATGNTLAYALSALQEAMSYGFGWDNLSNEFVMKVVTFVDNSNLNVCRSALEILLLLCSNPKIGFKVIDEAFRGINSKAPFANLVNLLASTDLNITLNALSLINTMIASASSEDYDIFTTSLDEASINQFLKKNAGSSDPDVKREMFIYQRNRLTVIKRMRDTPYDRENKEHEEYLMRLWRATFPNTNLDSRVSEQWKLIGFQGTDPATDFRGMGLLGLKNLLYFAEANSETFRKIVTEQAERKERDYPVAVAGINITQMLFDLFRIKEDPESFATPVIYMALFDHPRAFEEIYCTSLRVLDNTWDEMMASYMDFPRVIAAVKKLVSDIIATNPTSLDQFNRAALWTGPKQPLAQKAEEEEEVAEPEPIKRLKGQIRQEIQDLVKQQKVSYLLQGAWFKVFRPKAKQHPYVYCRLSENQSEFIYGPSANADSVPTDVQNVKLSECVEVSIGANTPMFNKQKKISPQDEEFAQLAFSIMLKDASKSLDFIAQTKDDFLNWTDGLRVVLSDKVENPETLDDLKTLTNLEFRIRLLELDGIEIPNEAPEIPPPPDNLNFCTA